MFEEYLKRSDVVSFIENIKSNEKYFQKELGHFEKYPFYISKELSLYILYDALFLYKVIVDDIYLFDEYLEQVELLYRKIDQFDQLIEGIHKLIGKMVSLHLSISDIDQNDSRERIISYIYDNYIQKGYFLHGFNNSYSQSIIKNGIVLEEYENYYDNFLKVRDIFSKYNVSVLDKDFSDKRITFTDGFIMSCIYSSYSPMFYSSFLGNSEYFGKRNRNDGYIIDDYSLAIYGLKKYMSDNLFVEEDRKFIIKTVKEEWDLLHREKKNISIVAVKRDVIFHKELFLEPFLKDDSPIYDIVDRMLSSKYGVIYNNRDILPEEIELISLDSYYEKPKEDLNITVSAEDEYYEYKEREVNQEFLDAYGKISIFLLIGSILIIFGVLITIIMILRGM